MFWHPEGWGFWNDDDSPNDSGPPLTRAQLAERDAQRAARDQRHRANAVLNRFRRKALSGLHSVLRFEALAVAAEGHLGHADALAVFGPGPMPYAHRRRLEREAVGDTRKARERAWFARARAEWGP